MDVDDELNGRTDFVFDSPTEQNKIWARHLADVILEGPSATNVSRLFLHTTVIDRVTT